MGFTGRGFKSRHTDSQMIELNRCDKARGDRPRAFVFSVHLKPRDLRHGPHPVLSVAVLDRFPPKEATNAQFRRLAFVRD